MEQGQQQHHQRISELVEEYRDPVVEVSDKIWEIAELRFEERRSCMLLEDILEGHGFRVTRRAGDIETAFVAEYGSGGPVIGILGEYDALPGLSQKSGIAHQEPVEEGAPGHGCGHNLLGTGALAAALAVRYYLEENKMAGTVRYYGCPAEEGGGGKVLMAAAGLFDGIDAAITWHPSSAHYVQSAATLATRATLFHFHGRSSHAASAPHLGRSALDAVELMNVGANYLREHVPTDTRLHYAITNTGGTAPNVVQAEASVRYQLRAPRASQIDEIQPRLCNIAQGAALMTETRVEIEEGPRYLNVIPNTMIERCMQEQLEKIGLPEYDETDREYARAIRETLTEQERNSSRIPETKGLDLAEKLSPYRPHAEMHMASTDVGDVSWIVPTVQYRSAVWAVGTQAHSWQAVAQGKCSYAVKGMLHAGRVMGATAVALMKQPELLEKAKSELAEALVEEEK